MFGHFTANSLEQSFSIYWIKPSEARNVGRNQNECQHKFDTEYRILACLICDIMTKLGKYWAGAGQSYLASAVKWFQQPNISQIEAYTRLIGACLNGS